MRRDCMTADYGIPARDSRDADYTERMPAWLPPPPPAIVIVMQTPQAKAAIEGLTFPCDESGVIHCSVVETVTANRSVEDMRIIAKYVALLSERNRRFYISWKEKLPSAAYEVVRRIRPFPFLPYGDMYAITDMQLILQESRDRIIVRYPKRPDDAKTNLLAEDDYASYETVLSTFITTIEKEIGKLKKYEGKLPEC